MRVANMMINPSGSGPVCNVGKGIIRVPGLKKFARFGLGMQKKTSGVIKPSGKSPIYTWLLQLENLIGDFPACHV